MEPESRQGAPGGRVVWGQRDRLVDAPDHLAFMQELVVTGPPSSIQELNARAAAWLTTQVHTRPHRVTGVPPAEHLETERQLLAPLPRIRYDTARLEPRRVGAPVPLMELDGVAYSAPPSLAGTMVEVRVPVDSGVVEIRAKGALVVTHLLAPPGSPPVWDPAHRQAAEAIALAPHLRARKPVTRDELAVAELLDLGEGDYGVETPDLDSYDLEACGCGSIR